MDIKLKRDVKPHITSDTTFDQLVEIAEKRDAIANSTERYRCQNQHSNVGSNADLPPKPRDTRNNYQAPPQLYSNNTTQHTHPSPQEYERRKRDGASYYCGRIGHYSSDCYLKKGNQNQNLNRNRGNGRRGETKRKGRPRRSYHTLEESEHPICNRPSGRWRELIE